jgi:hypothetical protein
MSEKNIIKFKQWTSDIYNSVEDDLKTEIKEAIKENPSWGWDQINFQDVYACAINFLPPIYTKRGKEPKHRLSKEEIRHAIYRAMQRVEANPLV